MKDRTEDVADACTKYENFEPVMSRLQDAFDPEWWRKVDQSAPSEGGGIMRLHNEGTFFFCRRLTI